MSRSRSSYQTFSDWLEIASATLHQMPYHSRDFVKDATFGKVESLYMERIKAYTKDELNTFSELLTLTMLIHHRGYSDFLGEVAGELELLNKRSGQFFTPYHLCRAIAKMTLGNVRAEIEEKGLIIINEPAVGAGALVIASAEEIESKGVDPRAYVQFDCTDISRDAFNMAYIQLSVLGLQAVVRHGNTLSQEYWESRPTPQLRLFDQWLTQKRKANALGQVLKDLLKLAGGRPVEPNREDDLSPVMTELDAQKLGSVITGDSAVRTTLFDLDAFTADPAKRDRHRRKADVVLRNKQIELPLGG